MSFLENVIDAKLVLFLNQLDVNASVSVLLEEIIAQFPVKNLKFLRDMFLTWQRHASHPPDVSDAGILRWRWAQKIIRTLPVATLPVVDNERVVRLISIMRKFAIRCTFNRSGDAVVKETLMVGFPPALLGILGATEAPYKKASQVYKDGFNDKVQDLIKTTATDRLMLTNWAESDSANDFVFFFYLGWEMLGQEKMPIILKNHELIYYENQTENVPQPFVLEGKIGLHWSNTLFHYANSRSSRYSIPALFFHYVRCMALVGDPCCRSLQCAVETPALLSARDPLYCLL